MNVYVLEQESCMGGDYVFNVNVFKDKETARKVMKEEIEELLGSVHYSEVKDFMDGKREMSECQFKWENDYEDGFFIKDMYADYHELLTISERKVYTKSDFKN